MTFRELWPIYRSHCVADGVLGPKSLYERDYTFKVFLEWVPDTAHPPIGDWQISEAKKFHLRDFIAAHPEWKSSSSKRAKANQINACLNWAVKEERIEKNPFHGLTYAEAPPRPPLDDKHLEAIMACAGSTSCLRYPGPNRRFERFLLWGRLTGLRLTSAASVEWSHVMWYTLNEQGLPVLGDVWGTEHPPEALWLVHLPPCFHKSGHRTKRWLTVALVPEAVELLKKLWQEERFEGVIFRSNSGNPWKRHTVGTAMRRIKKRLGIRAKGTFHGMRHAIGTLATRNGAPVKATSKALTHAGQAITERFYLHLDEDVEMGRRALDASLRQRRNGGAG